MSRLTLYLALREEDSGVGGRRLAGEALYTDDTVKFLDRVRKEAWRRPEQRWWAADMLSEHLWPNEKTNGRPNWHAHYLDTKSEIEDAKENNMYRPPKDDDGNILDGYHAGGVTFPEIAFAEPLTCPNCGNAEEFWDFTPVDEGDAVEPELRCHCGWEPPNKN